MGKFLGSTEKVEYKCTTTNFPLCNETIIVLKAALLHSASVITNFVISKRDKKKTKKNFTRFRLQPARDPRSPHTSPGDIEEVVPFLHPLTFFDPISSFAAMSD